MLTWLRCAGLTDQSQELGKARRAPSGRLPVSGLACSQRLGSRGLEASVLLWGCQLDCRGPGRPGLSPLEGSCVPPVPVRAAGCGFPRQRTYACVRDGSGEAWRQFSDRWPAGWDTLSAAAAAAEAGTLCCGGPVSGGSTTSSTSTYSAAAPGTAAVPRRPRPASSRRRSSPAAFSLLRGFP